jgi:hypothetical protein
MNIVITSHLPEFFSENEMVKEISKIESEFFSNFESEFFSEINEMIKAQVSHSKIRTTGRQPSAFQNLVDFWSYTT